MHAAALLEEAARTAEAYLSSPRHTAAEVADMIRKLKDRL
jgi:hypothetical protein